METKENQGQNCGRTSISLIASVGSVGDNNNTRTSRSLEYIRDGWKNSFKKRSNLLRQLT